jgi:hypothetical protein
MAKKNNDWKSIINDIKSIKNDTKLRFVIVRVMMSLLFLDEGYEKIIEKVNGSEKTILDIKDYFGIKILSSFLKNIKKSCIYFQKSNPI